MVWQNQVSLIVMLCPLTSPIKGKDETEEQREESINYWIELEQVGQQTFIDEERIFQLKLIKKQIINERITVRKF